MKLRMKAVLWDALGLDDADRHHLACCSFFLGRGVEETRHILGLPSSDPEVAFILSTALLSGYDPKVDSLIKSVE